MYFFMKKMYLALMMLYIDIHLFPSQPTVPASTLLLQAQTKMKI